MRSLLALGTTQSQLAADVAQLRDSPDGVAIVREALVTAIEHMQAAAGRLAARQLDDITRQAQQNALDQLRALCSDLNTQPTPDATDPSADPATETPPDPSSWPLATQLKVLARLQADIARHAAGIRSAVPDDLSPTDEQRAELQQLSTRQARLAELLEQLMSNPDEAVPEEQ
ncbi:MAG: hypothetical protein JNG89_09880 [Planctomycetaceae bacterium]|nr:hypothetical protein [Planctomycetaceae bacterium]